LIIIFTFNIMSSGKKERMTIPVALVNGVYFPT